MDKIVRVEYTCVCIYDCVCDYDS